jgi:ribonucrease Y
MDILYLILSLVIGIIIGTIACYVVLRYINKRNLESSENKSKEILELAKEKAETIKKTIDEERRLLYKETERNENEIKERRAELNKLEDRLQQKEDNLDKRISIIEKKEQALQNKEKELERESNNIEKERLELDSKLEAIAGLTKEEAKKQIIKQAEKEAEKSAFQIASKIENEAKLTAEKKAKQVIVEAMQRTAPEVVGDTAVSTVSLPGDEMKGRIIGREGRNIRTLENLIGVDIIIDDTPEAVVISCFDPIRRELARMSLEKLILDGRIHPTRIEEVVEKVNQEMETNMLEDGEKTCMDLGITGIHHDLQRYIGKLLYRTSYGQNVLNHSIEVAQLAGLLASQLGADIDMCKRAGILHDIGKSISVERFGAHAIIGGDLAKQYGESDKIVNAISAHHNDVEAKSLEAVIIQVADAISASRPGARRESFENYIKRLETLEKIANEYEGVEKAYAIQAGREVRIVVNHEDLDDLSAKKLARDIANKIECEVKYPGQIKVTVIRETRITEYAK